eukprot:8363902-Ditylum_brightwellii.AAC.1
MSYLMNAIKEPVPYYEQYRNLKVYGSHKEVQSKLTDWVPIIRVILETNLSVYVVVHITRQLKTVSLYKVNFDDDTGWHINSLWSTRVTLEITANHHFESINALNDMTADYIVLSPNICHTYNLTCIGLSKEWNI